MQHRILLGPPEDVAKLLWEINVERFSREPSLYFSYPRNDDVERKLESLLFEDWKSIDDLYLGTVSAFERDEHRDPKIIAAYQQQAYRAHSLEKESFLALIKELTNFGHGCGVMVTSSELPHSRAIHLIDDWLTNRHVCLNAVLENERLKTLPIEICLDLELSVFLDCWHRSRYGYSLLLVKDDVLFNEVKKRIEAHQIAEIEHVLSYS